MIGALSEDSDQPGYPPSLICIFAVHAATDPKQRSPCIRHADLSLRWTHMSFCWFCRASAHYKVSCCPFKIKDKYILKSTYAKCTARSVWMHCKDKKQKNQFAVKCTIWRSKLLKFIFRKITMELFGEKWKLLIFKA